MKKNCFLIVGLSALALMVCAPARAVEIRRVYVASGMASRASFSSTERITFGAEVYNAAVSDIIVFTFTVYDPAGAKVLEHTGNSIPGTVGAGGSSLSDIAISRFYRTPGAYACEIKAVEMKSAAAADSKTSRVSFFVYSPILTLAYPPNNSSDLADNPLVFRWMASGATKYRISVDDDMAFYNTLFAAETFDTSYVYPQNPPDIRARLRGAQNYYWKVEGLDSYGNVIAASPQPFVFSIKDSASSQVSRDIGIISVGIEPLDEASALVKVEIKNLGSRGESGITLTLYADGVQAGRAQIDSINAAQSVVREFPVPKPKGEKFMVTAAHSFIDDNASNNILTVSLVIPSELAASRGRIVGKAFEDTGDKSKSEGIDGALISYSGPVSGEIKTAKNGQYQIKDLPLGTYKITASRDGFESRTAAVEITKNRAYPNVDFPLVRKAAAGADVSLRDFWAALRAYVSVDAAAKLNGYEPVSIDGAESREFANMLDGLKKGKIKITGETLE